MQVVNLQVVSFTIPAGNASGTGSLSGFTTLSKMVAFASWRIADGLSPVRSADIDVDIDVTSTSVITASRYDATATYAITVRAVVIEFGSDTNVYKGTFTMDGSTTSHTGISIGGTVTLTNTFGWHYRKSQGETSPSNDSDPDGRLTAFWIPSTTTVSVQRGAAKGACSGHWFVVESSTLTVQHVTHSITSDSSTSVTDTISSVTTGETFLMSSYYTDEDTYNDEGCWNTDLQNSTTVRFRRSYSAAATNTWYYFVVSDSNQTVQRGDFTGTGTTENTSISSVDTSLSFAKLTNGSSGFAVSSDYQNGNLDNRYNEVWLGSSTQINRQSGDGSSGFTLSWEVIELDAAPSNPIITDAGDEDFTLTETNIIVTGTNFGATQGSGDLELGDSSTYGSATLVSQSIDSWSDTSIQFDLTIGSLTQEQLWLYVTDNSSNVSTAYEVHVEMTPTITNADDELFEITEVNITLTGTNFRSTQGTGKLELVNNSVYASGTKVTQSIDSWSDTSIQFDLTLGSLTEIDLWLFVTNSLGHISTGYAIQIARTPTITDVEDEILNSSEIGVVMDGTYFQDTQGTGKLELSNNSTYATGTKVEQTIQSWSNTEIVFNVEIGSIGQETMWLWVTNDVGKLSDSQAVTITGLPISDGLWKTSSIQGIVTSTGLTTTVFLISDE